jgi:hypothetical protein
MLWQKVVDYETVKTKIVQILLIEVIQKQFFDKEKYSTSRTLWICDGHHMNDIKMDNFVQYLWPYYFSIIDGY